MHRRQSNSIRTRGVYITYLLDTNALIIFLKGHLTNVTLTESTMKILCTYQNLYVSIVALWEMAIKIRIGKLNLNCSMEEIKTECESQCINILPMKIKYIDKTIEMPLLNNHKDPFDRLILATALSENMTLISTDNKLHQKEYGAKIIW